MDIYCGLHKKMQLAFCFQAMLRKMKTSKLQYKYPGDLTLNYCSLPEPPVPHTYILFYMHITKLVFKEICVIQTCNIKYSSLIITQCN